MTKTPDAAALPPLLTLEQTAEILSLSLKTVRRRVEAGFLPVIRDGRALRVHPEDLRRYIAARRT